MHAASTAYWPPGHAVHLPWPGAVVVLPMDGSQSTQSARPDEGLVLPALHAVHTADPISELYQPAAHSRQLPPGVEYMPWAHTEHCDAPLVAANKPALHPRHTDAPSDELAYPRAQLTHPVEFDTPELDR